jgi:hypothetical protein
MKNVHAILSASALMFALPAAVNAAVAPTVVLTSADGRSCFGDNVCYANPVSGTGNVSQTSQYGAAFAYVDQSKAPTISTRGEASLPIGDASTSSALPTGWGLSEATLRYQFQLIGPSNSVFVPFHFISTGSVQIIGDQSYANPYQIVGNALSWAFLELEREGVPLVKQEVQVTNSELDATGQVSKSFTVDKVVFLSTQSVFDVTMRVKSFAGLNPNFHNAIVNGGLLSLASLDPYLYIDPAYAEMYKDYSIVFSEGIVNSLTPIETPIPATAPLFAAALMTLGARINVRRRKLRTISGL